MENLKHLNVVLDPYDPESLRLDQSFVETSGVKKLLTTVPVRKPNNQDFVRVHPDEAYRLTAAIRPRSLSGAATRGPPTAWRMLTSGSVHGH